MAEAISGTAVPANPAPAAPAAATPAAASPVVPANAATPPTTVPAAEPAPAAAVASPAQPAKAPVAVVESLIGGPEKTVEGAPPEPVKPAEPTAYDLKLPDGVEVDAPIMDSAKAIFAEGKVSPETAQKLVTLQADAIKAIGQQMLDKQIETWNTTIRGWQQEVAADKDLGGAKWADSKKSIEGGLQTVFGVLPTTPANAPERMAHKAFVDALAYTGAGSNLAILRGLHRMVASRSEGRPAPVGGPSAPKKSAADVLYQPKQAAAE